jgi:hypothetical protein
LFFIFYFLLSVAEFNSGQHYSRSSDRLLTIPKHETAKERTARETRGLGSGLPTSDSPAEIISKFKQGGILADQFFRIRQAVDILHSVAEFKNPLPPPNELSSFYWTLLLPFKY